MSLSANGYAAPARVNAKKLCEYFEELKRSRQAWECLWQDIALYVVPRRYPGMNGTIVSPGTEIESRLFDTTAVQAHQVNANGCLAWMTPKESAWFSFTPPGSLKDDGARRWLAKASQTSREMLARSGFYLAVHEFYLDRSAFGTACLYAEPGEDEPLIFQCWSVGTFCIAEDHNGKVNTVIREFKLKAEQAEAKFGRENLPKPIQEALENGGAELLKEFKFLHFIMPRRKEDRENGNTPQEKMPWACYYLEADSKHLCRESGYEEMPCFVSRYLEWGTGTGGVYGWAPAFSALPEARQVNHLQKMMDALAEKLAFPPVLAPEELEGEIDPNAAGVTYFSKDLETARLPAEWMKAGKYDVGKDRVIERQNAIKEAFGVPMFQMFAEMERTAQMTAREVAERSAEKLVQFSPTFDRLTTELCNPMLQWLFSTLLRQMAFGPWDQIPRSLLSPVPGGAVVAPPKVEYSGKIALALRNLPTLGLWRLLELLDAVSKARGDVSIFDNFDWDTAARTAAVNEGVDADLVVPLDKVEALRAARAEAQQKIEEMQMAQMSADAAGKIGGIKADSLVGQQLKAAA